MEKTILKRDVFGKKITGHYSFTKRKVHQSNIITHFLIDSYNGNFIRKWLSDSRRDGLDGNHISLDKKNDKVIFSSLYDKREPKLEFAVTREVFSKMLDEWEQAIAQEKEFIVIEVSDDKDVHIYATDNIELSS